ncbi:MAG: SprT family zinc-dependent metalloprotease [Vulcanimicrobiota bacterium]
MDALKLEEMDCAPLLANWARRWGQPGLEQAVTVKFSRRMTATLGRCWPARGEIRLSQPLLTRYPELLEEALCHEFAHFVVYRLHGKARPHGREWQTLVDLAGYPPRTQVEVVSKNPQPRTVYIHRCPVCGASRKAGRPMSSWRCSECVEAGLDGRLEVVTR